MNRPREYALVVPCPECGERAGSWCVFIWPKTVPVAPVEEYRFRARSLRDRLALVGTRMQSLHNRRCNLFHEVERRRQQREQQEQLRTWLLAYGDIFEENK